MAKTSPAKKSPAKKPSESADKKALLSKLNGIVKSLDEEGIAFLIEQAKSYTSKIDDEKIFKFKKASKIAGEINQPLKEKTEVPVRDKRAIEVKEADDNSYFVIVINNYRNFFSLDEMRKLVKICHVASDERDAAKRLFTWFSANRKDVISNTEIRGVGDVALVTIYNYIVSHYKVKE